MNKRTQFEMKQAARNRERCVNVVTGSRGNLISWTKGNYCEVFIKFDDFLNSVYETWLKENYVAEVNYKE